MNAEQLQFLLTAMMELITLGAAYLALRLYKRNWKVRMAILGVPFMVNTLLYIIYHTMPFFYLGVILVICLPFVWPRRKSA